MAPEHVAVVLQTFATEDWVSGRTGPCTLARVVSHALARKWGGPLALPADVAEVYLRIDRTAAGDAVGAGGIAAPSLLPTVRQVPEVEVVSEKSAASVAVLSLESPRRAQTGFGGPPGKGSGG